MPSKPASYPTTTTATHQSTRRSFLQIASGAGLAAAAVACTPAAGPPAPPSAAPSGGSEATQESGWQRQWDTLVAEAKKEGKLIIATLPGAGYRKSLEAFEAAFPGIGIEHAGMFSRDLAPRIIQERNGGVFAWDIAQIPSTTALSALHPIGAFDPIRAAIFRPDVTDDRVWHGGFEDGFVDNERKWTYSFGWTLGGGVYINTDIVSEASVKSLRDVLDPQWKGRIISLDPRTGGAAAWPLTVARVKLGDGVLQRLYLDQEVALTREPRQAAEAVVRGRHAFAIGTTAAVIAEFQAQGLGKQVKLLLLPELAYISGETVWLMNRAPHPNAARLYINWLLTKQGQEAWSRSLESNTRRNDVAPVSPATLPPPDAAKSYIQIHRQQYLPEIELTQEMTKKLIN